MNELLQGAQDRIAAAIVEVTGSKFCIGGDVHAFLAEGKRDRWGLGRKKSWWEVEIQKRDDRRIREMIGPGKFIYKTDEEGREIGPIVAVDVEASLQPATPLEHDIFEAIAKHHDGDIRTVADLSIENGALKVSLRIPVPELESVNAVDHPDGRTGIVLKSDADEKRAADAKAAEDARKAQDARDKKLADDAAKAQKVQDDALIGVAARAGADAAAEVLKQSKGG